MENPGGRASGRPVVFVPAALVEGRVAGAALWLLVIVLLALPHDSAATIRLRSKSADAMHVAYLLIVATPVWSNSTRG